MIAKNKTLEWILKDAPIIPVIVIDNLQHALPLAQALQAGGISTLEITLRTQEAYDVIELLNRELPKCTVGAGTIVEKSQLSEVKKRGASFAISPGISEELILTANELEIPYLPAVATPSEVLLAKRHQLSYLKFFPADVFGGVKTLKNYGTLFPSIKFVPTGGIDKTTLKDYISLPNVMSVGGSWLAPSHLMREENWDAITELARSAMAQLI